MVSAFTMAAALASGNRGVILGISAGLTVSLLGLWANVVLFRKVLEGGFSLLPMGLFFVFKMTAAGIILFFFIKAGASPLFAALGILPLIFSILFVSLKINGEKGRR